MRKFSTYKGGMSKKLLNILIYFLLFFENFDHGTGSLV